MRLVVTFEGLSAFKVAEVSDGFTCSCSVNKVPVKTQTVDFSIWKGSSEAFYLCTVVIVPNVYHSVIKTFKFFFLKTLSFSLL